MMENEQESEESEGAGPATPRRWQITIPGFEYNPNGADYYPDTFEEFEGTADDLRDYILKRETAYQVARHLHVRAPNWVRNRHDPAVARLSKEEWTALGYVEDAPCDVWCRGIMEVREAPEGLLAGMLTAAKSAAPALAEARVHAAVAKVQAADAAKVRAAEEAERAELARLLAKHGPLGGA